ncbi:hypothetical protein HOO65_040353 [Ceratocystis lukuohia]|uniref:Uncharacterized protein n=2 Tax=Ceratocystis TaxID=5157 RepID=A0A2C5WZ70_9PEZI|nr:hypothetical protein CFIMG_007267RA00001 [Ceratocystis fimbriata CBS 114723]
MSPSPKAPRTERRTKKDPGHIKYARLTIPTLTTEDREIIYNLVNSGCVKGATKRTVTMEFETTDSIAAAMQSHGGLRNSSTQRPGRPHAINEEMATRLRIALILTPTATAEQLIAKTGCTCSVRTVQRNMPDLRAEADRLAEYVIEEFQQDMFDLRGSARDIQIPESRQLAPAPLLQPAFVYGGASTEYKGDKYQKERSTQRYKRSGPEESDSQAFQSHHKDYDFQTPNNSNTTHRTSYQTPPYHYESEKHTPQFPSQHRRQQTPQHYETPQYDYSTRCQNQPQHTLQYRYQPQPFYPQYAGQSQEYGTSNTWMSPEEYSSSQE